MYRILFYLPVLNSTGESSMAAQFATDVVAHGGECFFIASEDAARWLPADLGECLQLEKNDLAGNLGRFQRAAARFRPDLIILLDYYHLLVTGALFGVYLPNIAQLGVGVASFDIFGFGRTGRTVYYPLIKKRVYWPPFPPAISWSIRCCPVHNPLEKAPGCLYVPLIREIDRDAAGETRARMRARLGISRREKVVLMPFSGWAWGMARAFRPSSFDILARVYAEYFRSLRAGVRLIEISPQPFFLDPPSKNVTLQRINSLPPADYARLVCSSDLVLCDNAISNTVGLALHRLVPTILIYSSMGHDEDGGLATPFPLDPSVQALMERPAETDLRPVFPFHVYPVGLYRELDDLLKDNPYTDALIKKEFLDVGDVKETMERILWDSSFRKTLRGRQADYRSFLNRTCSSPVEGLTRALSTECRPAVLPPDVGRSIAPGV